ncbi:hypothetical protein Ancab_019624, partial [Ancistrocladus abbreviatus]
MVRAKASFFWVCIGAFFFVKDQGQSWRFCSLLGIKGRPVGWLVETADEPVVQSEGPAESVATTLSVQAIKSNSYGGIELVVTGWANSWRRSKSCCSSENSKESSWDSH